MNEVALQKKLLEIAVALNSINQSPSGTDDGLYMPADTCEAEALLDHIRMQIKYLQFDLEASNRENRYLRQMLEFRPPSNPQRDDDSYGEL